MTWYRCRFQANLDDYRPIIFPPPGPYWCSGYSDSYSIVIAYFPMESEKDIYEHIKEYWPEASNIDIDPDEDIVYTDRFPKPE